jgi:hypothetical protein
VTHSNTARDWATGGMMFAATMMLLIGCYQVILGIAAIARDSLFVMTHTYVYAIDTTTWGWIHLAVGVLVVIAGLFLYTGVWWARLVGVVTVLLSALDNFVFLPRYPVWSLVIIGLDVFVIWALVTAGRANRSYPTADARTGPRV